jgi:hypothetical protein
MLVLSTMTVWMPAARESQKASKLRSWLACILLTSNLQGRGKRTWKENGGGAVLARDGGRHWMVWDLKASQKTPQNRSLTCRCLCWGQ